MYAKEFIRDIIHKRDETFVGFPCKVFMEKINNCELMIFYKASYIIIVNEKWFIKSIHAS